MQIYVFCFRISKFSWKFIFCVDVEQRDAFDLCERFSKADANICFFISHFQILPKIYFFEVTLDNVMLLICVNDFSKADANICFFISHFQILPKIYFFEVTLDNVSFDIFRERFFSKGTANILPLFKIPNYALIKIDLTPRTL